MSMFTKYEDNSYTAYNLTPPKTVTQVIETLYSPIAGYDKYGNIKIFIWDPQDEFKLNLKLGTKIKVFENSVLFDTSGSKPGEHTVGYRGQKAYNLADGISWTCKGTVEETTEGDDWIPISGEIEEDLPEWIPLNDIMLMAGFEPIDGSSSKPENVHTSEEATYVWEQDTQLDFPLEGTKEVLLRPNMENKTLYITFENFRHEVIYTYDFLGQNEASIQISPKDTPLLVEGQFLISVFVKDSSSIQNIIQYNVTIMENPVKYRIVTQKTGQKVTYNYKQEVTIQEEPDTSFIWEPLYSSSDNDYVWIPL